MVSCVDTAIDPTSWTPLVTNQALCHLKSPQVSVIAIASRAAGPMVISFHHMVNSGADTITDQVVAMIFRRINKLQQQARCPHPAIPILLLGQAARLLNNQGSWVILIIR